jgi:hypothetical protein
MTVLIGISTITGDTPAPIPKVTGGGVRWTRLTSIAEVRNGVGSPRRLSLFASSGAGSGPVTISVPPLHKQQVSWSVVQAAGRFARLSSTGEPLAGPPASVALPAPTPTGTVVAVFLVGTAATINAVSPAGKLGQGNTPTFSSSTSTFDTTGAAVEVRWTPDGPGHYLGIIVEMDR